MSHELAPVQTKLLLSITTSTIIRIIITRGMSHSACVEEIREHLGFSSLFSSFGVQELNEDDQACATNTFTDWPFCQPRLNACYLNFTNEKESHPTFYDM